MPFPMTVQKDFGFAGKDFSHAETKNFPEPWGLDESCPVAWPGTLTTHTSSTAGTLTMTDAGHAITTASHIDLYWTDTNGNPQSAYGALVGTVSGTTVPFTLAAGTAIPAASTAIVAGIVQSFTPSTILTGNDMGALLASGDGAAARITLILASGPTVELAIEVKPNGCYEWLGDGTNPLAGVTVDTVHMSHGDTSQTHNVTVVAGLNV